MRGGGPSSNGLSRNSPFRDPRFLVDVAPEIPQSMNIARVQAGIGDLSTRPPERGRLYLRFWESFASEASCSGGRGQECYQHAGDNLRCVTAARLIRYRPGHFWASATLRPWTARADG